MCVLKKDYLHYLIYLRLYIYIIRSAFYLFFSEIVGGGGGELSLRFSCLLP